MTYPLLEDVSSKNFSRPARRWLAQLQLAYFSYAWGSLSITSADVEFARDPGGIKTGATSRRKPFEGLYSDGTCLPDDVVVRLDRDPRFQGILSFSLSPFWNLFGKEPRNATEAQRFVEAVLAHLKLRRLGGLEEEQLSANLALASSNECSYESDAEVWETLQKMIDVELKRTCGLQERCCYSGSVEEFLNRASCGMTRRLVCLDVLGLLGALFRELQLTFELAAAERIGYWFWILLEEFLSHPAFFSIEENFKTYCVNRLLYGRTDRNALKSFRLNGSLRLPGKPIGKLIPE